MSHSSETTYGQEWLGGPLAAHRAWCVSEGMAPEAWRSTLNDDPEGRRLYAALEFGEIRQVEWHEGTAVLLGAHVDPVNLKGRGAGGSSDGGPCQCGAGCW